MKRNQKKGILALLGVTVASGLAYWKYRSMSPAEREKLKAKVENAGEKIKETATDVEKSISDKYRELKTTVRKETDKAVS